MELVAGSHCISSSPESIPVHTLFPVPRVLPKLRVGGPRSMMPFPTPTPAGQALLLSAPRCPGTTTMAPMAADICNHHLLC